MGLFRQRALDRALIEELREQNRALRERLTAVETRAKTSASADAAADAAPTVMQALVGAFGAMASGLSKMMATQTDLTNKMMERTYRQQLSTAAAEMGRRGRAKRVEKETAEKLAEQQGALALIDVDRVKECEECAAVLEGRAPLHTNHLMRHRSENHEGLVLPLVRHAAQNSIAN